MTRTRRKYNRCRSNSVRRPRGARVSGVPRSGDRYAAFFDTTDLDPLDVEVTASEPGREGTLRVRGLWVRLDLGKLAGRFAVPIPAHGAGLYRFR
jgi:hypothetical protein